MKSTKRICSQLEVANGMLKTTLRQLGKQFNSFYVTSDLYLNVWSFWNTELKRVQVKTSVSFAWSSRKNVALPSFSRGSLFSTCLDCFLIFVLTCNECVTVFIQCFSPILLRFILSCFDISEWKAFLIWWNLPFCTVKILMIDTTTRN